MRTWILIFAVAFSTACRKAVVENGINPGVVSPGARIHGQSYGEWSARWWKLVLSIPSADNPLLHDDKCEVGQAGPVWFLTGKWGDSPIVATRQCAIPAGKYLFFPVVNNVADNVGYDPPKTVHELRASSREQIDSYVGTKCWLDGKEIQGLGSPQDSPYRVVSPVFNYRAPVGDFRGYPARTLVGPVVADGIFLMLKPLTTGRHTIRFTASSLAFSYSFDVTHQIDIVPPKK